MFSIDGYTVRTIFEDSKYTCGGKEWTRAPHGNRQGNGSSPALWNGISSPLFDIVREQGYGMKIESPITKTHLHFTVFGYHSSRDLIGLRKLFFNFRI